MGSVSATPALPLAVAAAGGHGMYPGSRCRRPRSHPCSTPRGARRAFGVNFIVPLMDRASLELAAERAPYVDFFLADADPALVDARPRRRCGLRLAGRVGGGGARRGGRRVRRRDRQGVGVGRAQARSRDRRCWRCSTRCSTSSPSPLSPPVGSRRARGVAAALAAGRRRRARRYPLHRRRRVGRSSGWVDAVIGAGAADAVVSDGVQRRTPAPGPHRVLRSSIEAAEALADGQAGVIRLAGAEIPVAALRAQPPTRESTGTIERCRSTPASRPVPSTRSSPPPRSSPSWPRGCRTAG